MEHAALDLLLKIGRLCRDRSTAVLHEVPLSERIAVERNSESDVIYRIDEEVEDVIVKTLEQEAESIGGVLLVAEGIGETERTVYPTGQSENAVRWQIIMDPIDGTRGLMYDKRSAFFLAGIAPNKNSTPMLSDIECAVMVELPTSRNFKADVLWAVRGQGAEGLSENLFTQEKAPFLFNPGIHKSLLGGFAQINRFFPPGKTELASLEESLLEALFPEAKSGEILTFEDQYICNGGQIYEMLRGNDRFVADIRAALYKKRARTNKRTGMATHPYDLAAILIAEEAGILITDIHGHPLDAAFGTTESLDFIAYANKAIYEQVSPTFNGLLKKQGFTE